MTGTAHHVDTTAKLVTMANQIARHLTHDKDPVSAVADHIHAFWTVRMQQQLLAHGPDGMDAVAIAALDRLSSGVASPGRNAATDALDHGCDAG
jgi:formate dehydrogenase subunit delta